MKSFHTIDNLMYQYYSSAIPDLQQSEVQLR